MEDRIEREIWVEATGSEVWEAMTEDGWLADEARLELWPGGEAWFRCEDGERAGWVEEAVAPVPEDAGGQGRLVFWWAADGEPASRVALTISQRGERTRVRVVEERPLEILDLVGMPLARTGGRFYGPALVAA